MSILLGAGGSRNVKEIYIGVGGAPHKVKEGYIGVGGAARRFYSALPPKGRTLEEYTWAEIRGIADAGAAAEYGFKVGDKKAVQLNGTVSTITVSGTYYVYIIGFDHNADITPDAKNSIDFGTFMNEKDTSLCLVDSFYNKLAQDSTHWFNINHSYIPSKSGGWKGCGMRFDILGSTKVKGEDAAGDTATNPKEDTLMSALPAELRAVMKPMTVYTWNGTVSTSVDYLPLLAEYEVFGSRDGAYADEPTYQKQYEYYKSKGRTKYQHVSQASANWWLRSPSGSGGGYWCAVNSSGGSNDYGDIERSLGVAPIFRV